MKKYPSIFLVSLLCFLGVFPVNSAVAITPPNSGSVFSDDSAVGNRSWSNPSHAQSSDDSYVAASLTSSGDQTHYLKATGYGFSIPPGSIINGIQVSVERKQVCTSTCSGSVVTDNIIRLVKGGVVSGSNKASVTSWPLTDTTVQYGGSGDLWGTTWSASDINNANFGAVLSAHRSIGGSRNLSVDQISITVFFTIPDTIAPIITPPAEQTFEATGPSTSPTLNPATATDDTDPSPVVTSDISSFSVGTTTVTWTATDASGNSSATTSEVVIVDTTLPEIILNGNNPFDMFINTDYASLNPDPDYSASDLVDGDVTSSVVSSGKDFNNAALGTYTITYNLVDSHGNGATTTRTVNVIDTIKPIIYRIGLSPVTVEGGQTYTDLGATAVDRDGTDITTSIIAVNPVNVNAVGTYTVTYDVTGAELGTTTGTNIADQAKRTVRVVDTTVPTITLIGSDPMIVKIGDAYVDPGANTTDNIDAPKILVGTPSSIDTSVFGTTTVTYSDTDSSGNTSSLVRNVIVRNLGIDSSLASLSVSEGSLSPSFNPINIEYAVELPFGTTEIPTISGTAEDSFATSTTTQAISITSATTSERTASILVTSEDGLSQNTYSVIFSIGAKPSSSSSGGSSSGGHRHPLYGLGQVLGAQSTNWYNLSEEERVIIIRALQGQLAEIIRIINELIKNGDIK